jgi:tetraprenyl-beta-curcumene synthase
MGKRSASEPSRAPERGRAPRTRIGPVELALSPATFAVAAFRYWLSIFPRVCLELRRWRRRARRIADPAVRAAALAALAKRSNMEGAAAFAVLASSRRRAGVAHALVAFQAIYNHVDMLAERHPGGVSVDQARRLHHALLVALDPEDVAGLDLLRLDGSGADDGYLAALVERCHAALSRLPSYPALAPLAHVAAARIVEFQSLSVGPQQELEAWARREAPPGAGFRWWETAAAAGSSLGVHAIIAAAASPTASRADAAAIDDACFPAIGALHSLLDSLVDLDEDAVAGQLRLLDCYPSRADAAAGMGALMRRALTAARQLPRGRGHELLVVAMACSYVSVPEAMTGGASDVARAVRAELGARAWPALLVFKLRRLVGGSAALRADPNAADGIAYGAHDARETRCTASQAPAPVHVEPCDPRPDARAA